MTFAFDVPLGANLGLIICLVIETIFMLGARAALDDRNRRIRHLRDELDDIDFENETKVSKARAAQRDAEQKLEQYKQEMREVLKGDPVIEECSEELAAWIREEQTS